MSLSSYQALIQELGAQLGAADMQADDTGYIALTIDTIQAHLQYDAEEDRVLLFTRLPAVEVDRAAEIYGLLLAANLFWQGTGGATFSIDFNTGRVFLADRRGREGVSATVLSDWLEGFVDVALHWQGRLETANAGGPLFEDTDEAGPPGPGVDGFSGLRV